MSAMREQWLAAEIRRVSERFALMRVFCGELVSVGRLTGRVEPDVGRRGDLDHIVRTTAPADQQSTEVGRSS